MDITIQKIGLEVMEAKCMSTHILNISKHKANIIINQHLWEQVIKLLDVKLPSFRAGIGNAIFREQK